MVNKSILDENNKVDVIVAWVVSAKNALHTCYGYSPNQLVFGRNPNFLSNLTKKPPIIEPKAQSHVVLKHMNVTHEARNRSVFRTQSNI